jgi:septum formation protein
MSSGRSSPSLVLASGSWIRKKLLTDLGVTFDVDPADIDEDGLVTHVLDPEQRARTLAIAKARHVSLRHPGSFVLGGDQVGVLDNGTFLTKPTDAAHHCRLLNAMSGRRHTFFPAVALVRDGAVLGSTCDRVVVTMRRFSPAAAEAYVATGEGRGSCGGYESEHRGAQLLEHVEGDLQAVLGFPLRYVLALLREHCFDTAGLLPL